jgi:hypothetical protein
MLRLTLPPACSQIGTAFSFHGVALSSSVPVMIRTFFTDQHQAIVLPLICVPAVVRVQQVREFFSVVLRKFNLSNSRAIGW